jgi:hypothetical protein
MRLLCNSRDRGGSSQAMPAQLQDHQMELWRDRMQVIKKKTKRYNAGSSSIVVLPLILNARLLCGSGCKQSPA